ncbi:hypothetical protein EJK80_10045 [Corynebacterium phoceense]|uniref:Uncharacterized protein n=1 Tax=Corynebacterium phoceense TaxID=1686286 RepID=A0A540R5I7_9CORY|nr:hypothetical protein EJK80_10045 [Corynebacterium phoceense]
MPLPPASPRSSRPPSCRASPCSSVPRRASSSATRRTRSPRPRRRPVRCWPRPGPLGRRRPASSRSRWRACR